MHDRSGSGQANGKTQEHEGVSGGARAGAASTSSSTGRAQKYDAVIVGASLAGCTTAIMLGRAGLNVAIVEQRPDPTAFKRICGHFIQSSAVPTLERLLLLEPIEAAGGVRSGLRMWTRWGVIEPPSSDVVAPAVNLRRERLDPLVREIASSVSGVEMILGYGVTELVRADDAVVGIRAHDRHGRELVLRAALVVGADGRDSTIAKLAGVRSKVSGHGRFSYATYFEGPPPTGSPDGTIWMLDPQWAAAFPTDGGEIMYGCMPTKDRLPEFRRDPDRALRAFVADIPDAPPILQARQVGPTLGKIEMPNVQRAPVAPGLALVGDAALATDPLFGVGCGWAFQSAEWLAEAVMPALRGQEPLRDGLASYRRRFRRGLGGHAALIHDYATGRRFSVPERVLFSAAAYDPKVGTAFSRFGTRNAGPASLIPMYGRSLAVHARRLLGKARGGPRSSPSIAPEALA
jgi:2-polyprenyl-6-methoxyphenol hydroxylase-like FAD-dependent oxidoreductase